MLSLPGKGLLGSTPSSSHHPKYSSTDRSNSRRTSRASVASNVAIGYGPLFAIRPCRTSARVVELHRCDVSLVFHHRFLPLPSTIPESHRANHPSDGPAPSTACFRARHHLHLPDTRRSGPVVRTTKSSPRINVAKNKMIASKPAQTGPHLAPADHTAMRAAMDNSTRFHGSGDSRRRLIRAVRRSPRSIIWEQAVLAVRGTYPSLDSPRYTATARRS